MVLEKLRVQLNFGKGRILPREFVQNYIHSTLKFVRTTSAVLGRSLARNGNLKHTLARSQCSQGVMPPMPGSLANPMRGPR